nr:hypothetical protein Iba_chr05dCG17740 [Ipomoea batatas]
MDERWGRKNRGKRTDATEPQSAFGFLPHQVDMLQQRQGFRPKNQQKNLLQGCGQHYLHLPSDQEAVFLPIMIIDNSFDLQALLRELRHQQQKGIAQRGPVGHQKMCWKAEAESAQDEGLNHGPSSGFDSSTILSLSMDIVEAGASNLLGEEETKRAESFAPHKIRGGSKNKNFLDLGLRYDIGKP